jgi:hypothetical protein
MAWPKKLIFRASAALALVFALGCGVRGDPLPPEKPAEIGRGRPTYKRASEEIQIEKTPALKKPVKADDDEDDDDKN